MALLNQSIATREIKNFLLIDLISILILIILSLILLGVLAYRDFKRKTFLKKRTKKRTKKLRRKLIKKFMLEYGLALILPILVMILAFIHYMPDLANPQVIVIEGYVNFTSFAGGGRRRINLQHSEGIFTITRIESRHPGMLRTGNFYRIYYTPHTRTIIHVVRLEEHEVFIDEN